MVAVVNQYGYTLGVPVPTSGKLISALMTNSVRLPPPPKGKEDERFGAIFFLTVDAVCITNAKSLTNEDFATIFIM
jgi:hypothetical protein